MRHLIPIILSLVSICSAHEIDGLLTINGNELPRLNRAPIGVASGVGKEEGRIWVLWIAPDGALAFHVGSDESAPNGREISHV